MRDAALRKEAPSSTQLRWGSRHTGMASLLLQWLLGIPETQGNLRKGLFWQTQ